MKRNYISLVVAAMVATGLNAADTLEDALKSGKITGDVSVFFEGRNVTNGTPDTYYANTGWAVGSVGLGYKTGSYNNFSAAIGFRAAAPLWEDNKHFQTGHGTGDSTERIYEDDRVLLGNLYLEYDDGKTLVRVGRQEMLTEWLGKYNDGVRITNKSIDNLTLDLFWTQRQSRVYFKEMWGATDRNKDNGGVYNVGATYQTPVGLELKVYGLYADEIFSAVGAKAKYSTKINNTELGGTLHYAQTNEKQANVEDGKMFEATLFAKANGYTGTLGYVQTGKKNGWGSINIAGDYPTVPFEEGDAMYEKDVKTFYGMINTNIQQFDLTVLYGTTEFTSKATNQRGRQDEVSVWASYPLTKSLTATLIYDRTFGASSIIPTVEQVGALLTYKF